jgi:hypothetical protein
MADYRVSIQMDEDTVNTLQNGGFHLFALKAVETSNLHGKPVIWFRSQAYSTSTAVNWTVRFKAYSAMEKAIPDGKIVASHSERIDLGQTFTITGAGGTGDVTPDGKPGKITIVSRVKNHPFSCGISQERDGEYVPTCAVPTDYGVTNLFTPVEKVFLMFATDSQDLGTVLLESMTDGFYIDLTDAQQRQVTYKHGEGWSAPGVWAKVISAGTDLPQLLVQPSRELAMAAMQSSPVFALRSGDRATEPA